MNKSINVKQKTNKASAISFTKKIIDPILITTRNMPCKRWKCVCYFWQNESLKDYIQSDHQSMTTDHYPAAAAADGGGSYVRISQFMENVNKL